MFKMSVSLMASDMCATESLSTIDTGSSSTQDELCHLPSMNAAKSKARFILEVQ